MDYRVIDRSNKKDKWTIMKYVANFDLLLEYASLIRELKFKVDEETIEQINKIMKDLNIYAPKNGTPSIDTTSFKICQIVYFMLAYRSSDKKRIIFSPLGNLLLDNRDDKEKVGKIFATMLCKMPFNHPYNRMSSSFNLFPIRLIFKLLLDRRLHGKLYADEVFYLVAWTKDVDNTSYEELVKNILGLRGTPDEEKIELFTKHLPIQDCLANILHETEYLFTQLEDSNIVDHHDGEHLCTLCHGGFGRGRIPDTLEEIGEDNYNPTGRRAYHKDFITIQPYISHYIEKLLVACPFDEKPHDLYQEVGTEEYILSLYNYYPQMLLEELGVQSTETQKKVNYMMELTSNIRRYSVNESQGDCYRFEQVLCDAFNEFFDVNAEVIAKAGTTDVECMYLSLNEKFDVEAKSTAHKLALINAGRLQEHRRKVQSHYTIIVAPNYVPSVLTDIEGTDNVLLTANSLCNYLYQSSIKNTDGISYQPIYRIIQENRGRDISRLVSDYVSTAYGIGS